jgi:hypothetical protein
MPQKLSHFIKYWTVLKRHDGNSWRSTDRIWAASDARCHMHVDERPCGPFHCDDAQVRLVTRHVRPSHRGPRSDYPTCAWRPCRSPQRRDWRHVSQTADLKLSSLPWKRPFGYHIPLHTLLGLAARTAMSKCGQPLGHLNENRPA